MNTLFELASHFLDLFLDSAPWLLLGLFMAGMIKMFVPMSWMEKQLGGSGWKPTIKAALFGAPLPLCSCGVIPAAVGLRRSGASKSATTAFLVATPETGVDSVSVSYVLLGPFMAVVRPIAAVTSAIVAGLLVGRDSEKDKPIDKSAPAPSCCSSKKKAVEPALEAKTAAGAVPEVKTGCCSSKTKADEAKPKTSCCASKAEAPQIKAVKAESGCCSSKAAKPAPTEKEKGGCCITKPAVKTNEPGVVGKLFNGIRYASTDLVDDTALWLLVGLFFAAVVNTFVPPELLAGWGQGIIAMTLMVLVSIPMYICATASTPIAAGLLLAGVSPGAVLVFMMAGPATNIATLGVVRNELGSRALWAYLGGVVGVAMLFGFAVDAMVDAFDITVMPMVGEEHRMLPDALVYGSGFLLALMMIRTFVGKFWRPTASLA